MSKTLFNTRDIFEVGGDAQKAMGHYADIARTSGLTIIEMDESHFTMVGTKINFLKYYIRSAPISIKHGQKISKEIKRFLYVLSWR